MTTLLRAICRTAISGTTTPPPKRGAKGVGGPLRGRRAFAAALAALVVCGFSLAGAAGQNGPVTLPVFERDSFWPKLPPQWKWGAVSDIAVNSRGRILVLQRPRSLPPNEWAMSAPAILEFDKSGEFVRGWGGPGQGFEWPEIEHGLHVDYQDNVWVSGNNCPERNYPGLKPVSDDQILKFDRDGKFLHQIGRSNMSKGNADVANVHLAADMVVNPSSNEVFVADGYGNHRVIVFDANTGAFKRTWGAFGGVAADAYKCPPNEFNREELFPTGPGPKQFHVVHGIVVSNDGRVYVADRNYGRIQVFTTDGKYLTQVFINRPKGSVGGVALSSDTAQRFLYAAGADVSVLDRTTLQVLGTLPGVRSGHQITADRDGNLYVAQVGPKGFPPGDAQRYLFKGLAPLAK